MSAAAKFFAGIFCSAIAHAGTTTRPRNDQNPNFPRDDLVCCRFLRHAVWQIGFAKLAKTLVAVGK
jgi:hypothetical protein